MTTTTSTDPAAIIGRAFELAAEADLEAEQYGRQQHDEWEARVREDVAEALADALPDLAPHAAISYCGANGGPDAIVHVGNIDAPLVRLEAFRSTWTTALYLAMPCHACGSCPVRGPQVDSLTTLGIALRSEVMDHDAGPQWDPVAGTTLDGGRCDGERITYPPAAPSVDPPAPWRVERVNTPIDLAETLTALTAAGYEVMWPPLMDGHVIAARLRG